MAKTLKKSIFDVIESPNPEDWRGKCFDDFMIVLIITNVLAVVLETVESLAAAYGTFFLYFEYFSVTIFTVEYLLRIWTAELGTTQRSKHFQVGRAERCDVCECQRLAVKF